MTENVNKFRAALSHPKKKASIFAIATIRLGGLTDIIQSFKNGEMKFVNKQLLTDEQWKELNEKLWERDFVRFVEHDGKNAFDPSIKSRDNAQSRSIQTYTPKRNS